MKKFLKRFTTQRDQKAQSAAQGKSGNRMLSPSEMKAQQLLLKERKSAEAARKKALIASQNDGPRNRPVAQVQNQKADKAAARSFWKPFKKWISKDPKKQAEKRRKNSIGVVIRDLLSGEFLTREGVTKHIPYLLFISFLFVAYIAMGYQFERLERQKLETKEELEELNAAFKTLQADFEGRLQQSSVEKNIADLGLTQPINPPFLLESQNPPLP